MRDPAGLVGGRFVTGFGTNRAPGTMCHGRRVDGCASVPAALTKADFGQVWHFHHRVPSGAHVPIHGYEPTRSAAMAAFLMDAARTESLVRLHPRPDNHVLAGR